MDFMNTLPLRGEEWTRLAFLLVEVPHTPALLEIHLALDFPPLFEYLVIVIRIAVTKKYE